MSNLQISDAQLNAHQGTIELTKEQITYNGGTGAGGLYVKIPGFKGNTACPDDPQVLIEVYEGKLQVHVWNDSQDPTTIKIDPEEA